MIKLFSTTSLNWVAFHDEVHAEFGDDIYISTTDTYISIGLENTEGNIGKVQELISNHDKEAADLDAAKKEKVRSLWSNVVSKQEQYFYSSDVIEVRGVVRQGSADNLVACTSIKNWIDSLYSLYYAKKSSIYNAADLEALNLVVLNFNTVADPAYSNDIIWS